MDARAVSSIFGLAFEPVSAVDQDEAPLSAETGRSLFLRASFGGEVMSNFIGLGILSFSLAIASASSTPRPVPSWIGNRCGLRCA